MRKITNEAAGAFYRREEFRSGNTRCDKRSFYLHGNELARWCRTEIESHGVQECMWICDGGGWQTPTTKERLNGLVSHGVCQVKGQWYLNGQPWEGEWMLGSPHTGHRFRLEHEREWLHHPMFAKDTVTPLSAVEKMAFIWARARYRWPEVLQACAGTGPDGSARVYGYTFKRGRLLSTVSLGGGSLIPRRVLPAGSLFQHVSVCSFLRVQVTREWLRQDKGIES